ncbi:hypothetical protein M378DRAFT_854056 [Amanita muscaria Koide BX008]|uniref:Uncharacterized protein n=1 Tax=Amanita muscaria (strain Koide BX008) TaxID=946122 RepID=A0A0C2WXJ6_AMAMK|nr:hypothetical protein M378DRAFT_854056 [Amanita muscaria Koide BX008]
MNVDGPYQLNKMVLCGSNHIAFVHFYMATEQRNDAANQLKLKLDLVTVAYSCILCRDRQLVFLYNDMGRRSSIIGIGVGSKVETSKNGGTRALIFQAKNRKIS